MTYKLSVQPSDSLLSGRSRGERENENNFPLSISPTRGRREVTARGTPSVDLHLPV